MQFYLRSAEAWVAILQECNAAQHSIQIEQYIIWDDEIGHMLLNVLTEKAKQQLKVQLILDDFGGRTINSSPALDALQAADGEVKFNRPLWWHNLFFPSTWFPRDHCKNIIIDGKAAYIGGICFAKHMQDWRDTQVRFEGQLAETVQQDFESCWDNLAYGTTSHSQMTAAQGHNSAEYVIQEPYEGKLNLYDAMLREIAKAQTYIHIVTPYFFPPRRLRIALRKAAKRGVRVVIMISASTDVGFIDAITRMLLPRWKRYGFDVLFYQPTMLHAKYAIIDGQWATIGSSNFDHLGLRLNQEANIIFHNGPGLEELGRHFDEDKTHCTAAGTEDLKTMSIKDRLFGKLGAMAYGTI